MSYDYWGRDKPTIEFENIGDGQIKARSYAFEEGYINVGAGEIVTIEAGPGKQVIIKKKKRTPDVTRNDILTVLANSDADDINAAADSIMALFKLNSGAS